MPPPLQVALVVHSAGKLQLEDWESQIIFAGTLVQLALTRIRLQTSCHPYQSTRTVPVVHSTSILKRRSTFLG